jgi:conjugal transfer pilus assembly protein TraV
MRVEGNSVVPDEDAIPLGGNGGESINPMPGKRDIDANVAKELKNMNVDISQFTKPLQNAGN